jgi:ATP-binding cassette subfamily B (MDR/TAP) protein 1
MDKAERATRSVFALLDRKSAVDPMTKEGIALPAGQRVAGLVELKNVTFAYPTRPDTPAIQNLSLTIRPGQKVALVGACRVLLPVA